MQRFLAQNRLSRRFRDSVSVPQLREAYSLTNARFGLTDVPTWRFSDLRAPFCYRKLDQLRLFSGAARRITKPAGEPILRKKALHFTPRLRKSARL